jgi:ribonuclease HI
MATDAERQLILTQELALLAPGRQDDPGVLERLLHRDFTEVGASGRRWSRDEIIAALAAAPIAEAIDASDLQLTELADDVVLLTFTTSTAARHAHRCSIWVRDHGRWCVIYHQGTPTPA